jgi:hypothetical protein
MARTSEPKTDEDATGDTPEDNDCSVGKNGQILRRGPPYDASFRSASSSSAVTCCR